jgi:hypothetical protein
MRTFFVSLTLLLAASFSVSGAEEGADSAAAAGAAAMLRGVYRIVFLGDSITMAGDYVTDCECWLLAQSFGERQAAHSRPILICARMAGWE